jgi:chromosome segregation ATPase
MHQPPLPDEIPQPVQEADNGVGGDSKRSDAQATSGDTDRAAIDLARVQGYVMRDLEILIGHTIEQAVSNATAPLLAKIEAQTAQFEQLIAAQRAAQADQAAAQASYAEAQASLAGRIEAQAIAQRLLMDALQQLRKDRAPETAGIALLSAEITHLKEAQQKPPEATQREIQAAMDEVFKTSLRPYIKQVQSVAAAVDKVRAENEHLKAELELAQHQRRPWWKLWRG